MMLRLLAVLVVLVAVAASDRDASGSPPRSSTALAYTAELGVSIATLLRPGAERREARARHADPARPRAPRAGLRARRRSTRPTEFEQHDWVPIHLGPLNLSITKAVAYLLIGTALTILLGLVLMRARLALLPDRRQTVGEALYEIAQTQIAEQGLPSKAIGRWFPYVATLLLFIFVVNLIGFIPLPLTGET